MNASRIVTRSAVAGGLAFALMAGLTPAASGATTPNLSTAPSILGGTVALGSASASASTQAVDWPGLGPCGPRRRPGSVNLSVFQIPSAGKRLMSLAVTDEDGSLCLAAVYRASGAGFTLTNPQDGGQRSHLHEASTDTCRTAPTCDLDVWLDSGASYYLVVWATPGSGSVDFDYTASIKLAPNASASVQGHRIVDRGLHEVIAGRPYTINALVPHTGSVRLMLDTWTGSVWRTDLDRAVTLVSGRASIPLVAASQGRRRFRASFAGSDTVMGWTSGSLEIHFVAVRLTRYPDGGIGLSVPWVRQRYTLSCEAASLRMALLAHGVPQDEIQILRRIGVDARARAGGRWGDPEKAFVGSFNGRMPSTGYGVHAPPVAKAATSFRPHRPALRLSHASWAEIARHLGNGFPVVIWGGRPGRGAVRSMSWTSWEGRRVSALLIEHTWTLVGFRGPASRPTHFIVYNPSGAAGTTMRLADVHAFTHHFGNSAVVVR